MSARSGHPMVLPTDREERQVNVGPWVRQLNIDEMREQLANTLLEIRAKILPVLAGLAVAAVAGGILITAKLVTGGRR